MMLVGVLLLTASPAKAICFGDIVFGVGVAVLAPYALPAIGFGAAGITAGSMAASSMSVAMTSGVGMGAVSTLQAAGAAGLTASQYFATAAGTTALKAAMSPSCPSQDSGDKEC